MRKRLLSMAMLALAVSLIVTAPAASAATVIGDQCTGDEMEDPFSFFEFSAPGNSLPTAAASAGVITRWSVNVAFGEPILLSLQTVRITAPNQLQVVSENMVNIVGGNNSFDARVAIQAGDRVAIHGPVDVGTPICKSGAEEAHLGGFKPVGPGSTTVFEEGDANFRIPVAATIEPDVDNDGFGDETQDACPQSAATQAACPVVTLSTSTSATKKSVTVLITGTTPTNVTVNGKVPLGKGKKAKLKGGTKAVAPGTVTKLKLKFPAKLIKRLKELPPSKKLTLKITSTAPNLAAAPTTKTLRVKLKGQAPTG